MTAEEAVQHLMVWYPLFCRTSNSVKESIDTAISALEKQIPTSGIYPSEIICDRKTVFCKCGHKTMATRQDFEQKVIYCYFCGQALEANK